MRKIKPILEKIYEDLELRETCIPLFVGNPGLGKTVIIEEFAKEKKVKLVEIIGSTKLPNEVSGVSMPDHDTKRMTYFDYDLLLDCKDGDIIFFDELLNTNTMVLNACLTILQNRTLPSGRKLPKVMIVAAANPQGATILTPQIKERFIFYDVAFNPALWGQYMYKKYNMPDDILTDICSLIKNENFENSRVNYITPRSIDKAVNMMIKEVDTPYKKDLGPILNRMITNTSDFDLEINSEVKWLKNEKISWLELKKQMNKKIEQNDKVNPEFETEVTNSVLS